MATAERDFIAEADGSGNPFGAAKKSQAFEAAQSAKDAAIKAAELAYAKGQAEAVRRNSEVAADQSYVTTTGAAQLAHTTGAGSLLTTFSLAVSKLLGRCEYRI